MPGDKIRHTFRNFPKISITLEKEVELHTQDKRVSGLFTNTACISLYTEHRTKDDAKRMPRDEDLSAWHPKVNPLSVFLNATAR
jgi:hypothetical protein